jgi:transposase
MSIVAGFDVHRAQITFDALDDATGEVSRGRIAANGDAVRRWVARFDAGEIHVAVEACTGWLFVCEALREAGAVAHRLREIATPPGPVRFPRVRTSDARSRSSRRRRWRISA